MIIYTDNTTFQKSPGVQSIYITSNFFCFNDRTGQGDYDLSHVSNAAIDRAAIGIAGKHPNLLLDIESFDLANDFENSVLNLQNALRRWKSADPSRMVGLYSIVPERDYWNPVLLSTHRLQWNAIKMQERRERCAVWQQKNDKLADRLVPFMDFICPSLYAFNSNGDGEWTTYAEANLSEAIRVSQGKPVWPIIWPRYHSGGMLTIPMWRRMVEFVSTFPGIDSLIAYGPDGTELPVGWEHGVTF